MRSTPSALGYQMPAEWERHDATWLAWPKDPLTFPAGIIERVERVYVEMIEALTEGERVDLLVDDVATERKVRGLLGRTENLAFHRIRTADVWTRDYAPIFVKGERGVAAVKWKFNAWGNKYEELKRDDQAGVETARSTGLTVFRPNIVLEGGSIDVNGMGTCLTTEQCLLNKNRNPHLSRKEVEAHLGEYLGATNVVWLKSGIAGDDTDGHVDDVARFVDEETIVCMTEDDPEDENCAPLKENLELLKSARDQKGGRLRVIPIAMPGTVESGDGGRLPASYANFYIGNSVVLLPVFSDESDGEAVMKLSKVFPGRRVVGIDCRALVCGFGGIHCITQQQPSAKTG